jgi:hypothetical protein
VTRAVKTIAAAAAAALGALFGIGFLLTALFELQGFGDRDSTPSGRRLVECAVGFVACILTPAILWRRLVPGNARAWPVALGVATAGVLLIAGLSLRA